MTPPKQTQEDADERGGESEVYIVYKLIGRSTRDRHVTSIKGVVGGTQSAELEESPGAQPLW